MSSLGSWVWTLGPQIVELFGEGCRTFRRRSLVGVCRGEPWDFTAHSTETEGDGPSQLPAPATVQSLAGLPCLPWWAAHLTVNPTSRRLLVEYLVAITRKATHRGTLYIVRFLSLENISVCMQACFWCRWWHYRSLCHRGWDWHDDSCVREQRRILGDKPSR